MSQKKYMVWFLMGAMTLLFLFVLLIIPLDPNGKDKSVSLATKVLEKVGLKENPDHFVTIMLGGDVMLGRSVMAKSIDNSDFKYPFTQIANTLANADLTLVNMENPIIDNCPKVYEDTLVFCGLPEMLEGVKYSGIDIVNLANNHAHNYGDEGIVETQTHLKDNNIAYVGLGNLVIREINDVKFGFLGFEFIDHGPSDADLKLISDSDKKADVLVVTIHWGEEYKAAASANQREWAG